VVWHDLVSLHDSLLAIIIMLSPIYDRVLSLEKAFRDRINARLRLHFEGYLTTYVSTASRHLRRAPFPSHVHGYFGMSVGIYSHNSTSQW
jgi:hypothetical protein